ncbi:N-acetylmuramoyl-L-alanine amidase, partial [bacterium]
NLKSIDNSNELKTYDFNLLGEKYKTIKEVSHKLKGYVYYLVGGHGGPDPGAIGYRNGNTLSEDEYAYDIVLRLAKNLLENGATVKLIVQDPNDGIRDDYYLNNSYNEIYYGNEEIPLNQLERLRKRVEIINKEYEKNRKWAKEQIVVPIHVDSRENKNSRIDVFFYYYQHSERGKYIATSLLNTFEAKYEAAQPGRGYNGSVTTRGLYMLRNCKPVTVYMELGNIQNERDQIRLVEKNNRQAIANWLSDGFLKLVD